MKHGGRTVYRSPFRGGSRAQECVPCEKYARAAPLLSRDPPNYGQKSGYHTVMDSLMVSIAKVVLVIVTGLFRLYNLRHFLMTSCTE